LARGKPKIQGPDEGLSPENFQVLNEEFYEGDPADYFMRRLQGLLILSGRPDAIRTLLSEGVEAGGARIQLRAEAGLGSESTEQDAEGRSRFITADAWLLLHHASETLLRLYLAHSDDDLCPPLQIARQRLPGAFKEEVKARFREAASLEHYAANGRVFYNSPTAEGLTDLDSEGREALLANVEGLLRLFADVFLDAESYNAIKHSMAIRTGHSRFNLTVNGMDMGTTEGPHIEYLGIHKSGERLVWAHKTKWLNLDLIVARIYVAHRMILALWLAARSRYVGASLEAVPSLGSPTPEELSRSDSVTWSSMARDLIYDSPV